MKRAIWIAVISGFVLPNQARGQTEGFWLGIIVGEPTGMEDALTEIVPVMDLFPETELGANAGIGV